MINLKQKEGVMCKEELKKEDIKILEFLSKYKLLKVEDASLIYRTKRYYRQRVNRLIKDKYVKKYKAYIMLDKKGRKALNLTGTAYIKNIQNEKYMDRLKAIARIATITINSKIKFIPSWDIKEKDQYTETARKYVGKIIIDEKEHLVYYIAYKKENVYIKQLLFDINKAINYDEIIIFVENLNVIQEKYANLCLAKENTYIILNTIQNKELLKKYEKIDIHELLEKTYKQEILISNWEEADYLLQDNTYIVNMIFINTEKIERINWYYRENSNSTRKIEVITIEENAEKLKEILSEQCKIKIIDRDLLNRELLGGMNETITE